MIHIKLFEQYNFLDEAISLKDARKATRIFLDSGGKKRYNEIFDDSDRLYYDFNPDVKNTPKSDTQKKVEEVMGANEYYVADYTRGLATKEGDSKNVFKIQRILTRLGEKQLRDQMDADPIRSASRKETKKVVISRHGIDIAGQSTGRGWTSCKELGKGNSRFVWIEIEGGYLVAYLIDENDLNIQNPLARILIGVFVNDKDPSDFVLYPDSSTYGNYSNPSFMKFVEKWCDSANEMISKNYSGLYSLSPTCYADDRRPLNVSGENITLENIFGSITGHVGGHRNLIRSKTQSIKPKEIQRLIDFASEDGVGAKLVADDLDKFIFSIKKYCTEREYASLINESPLDKIMGYLKNPRQFMVLTQYLKKIPDLNSVENKGNISGVKRGILDKLRQENETSLEETKSDLEQFINDPKFPDENRKFLSWLIS